MRADVLDLVGYMGERGDVLDGPAAEALGHRTVERLAEGALLNGRYRLEKVLAHGGFATVYVAADELLANRRVVIKVLDRVRDPGETLSREIRALAKITDPGVVGIFDRGMLENGSPFLVTQYIEGRTLREVLREGVPPRREGLRLIGEIARALCAAHEHGIPHLDLKPENIMVGGDGGVTIIDFGLSGIYASGRNVAGSLSYMAPEQRRGEPSIRSDIYALGVVACEILTGSPLRNGGGGPLREVGSRAASAIERALEEPPEKRQASAQAFLAELQPRRAPGWIWRAAGAATVLLGAAMLYQRLGEHPRPLLDPKPATSMTGLEDEPSYSPDGSRLYFTNGLELKSRDIYYVAGGEPVRLTFHPGDERRAVCSMDGKTIAFIRGYSGHNHDIVVMPALGGPETVVATAVDPENLAWAVSGQDLMVSAKNDEGGKQELRVLNLANGHWREFVPPPADTFGDIDPSLSPDGKWLAFVRRENPSASDLYVVRVNEHLETLDTPRRLTSSRVRKEVPQWTPDGKELVYARGTLGFLTIWRVSVEGGEEERIPELGSRINQISIPKHAWKLAYSVDGSDSNLWRLRLKTPEGPAIERAPIAVSSFHDEEGSYSPDSRQIVFTSQRNGSEQVFTANADGTGVKQVTFFETVDSVLPFWAQGGRSLLIGLNAKPEGRRSLLLDLSTGRFRTLVNGMMAVGVSADGQRGMLRSSKTGRDEIWSFDIASGQLTQRTRIGSRHGMEDARGNLYYSHSNFVDELWVLRPNGQTAKVVNDLAKPALFAIGERGIYYVRRQEPAICLKRFSDGKEVELLLMDKPPFWGFDVSADGKTILYGQYESSNVDVMVVKEFR